MEISIKKRNGLRFRVPVILLVVFASMINSVSTTSTSTAGNSKQSKETSTDVQTAPSTTSIHQVWTSTSTGGRLDELSPEMISKLRQDVPFLAAYALRPRLVGLGGGDQSTWTDTSVSASSLPVGQLQAPVSREIGESRLKASLQTSASSPVSRTSESLVPQLGEFSEFNVETLSTSKSEHRHKRRTSLKRNDELNKKRRVLATASQLISNKRKNSATKSGKRSKRQQKSATKKTTVTGSKRRDQALLRSQVRAGRLRQKVNRGNLLHHMNIIKHGRYSQLERQTEVANGEKPVVGASEEVERDEPVDDSGVKGGAGPRTKGDRKPFYSKASSYEPSGDSSPLADDGAVSEGMKSKRPEDELDKDREADDERELVADKRPGDKSKGKEITEVDDDGDDDHDHDNGKPLATPSPKRVGDDDVEEGGDTVTVMPKSDGVDDDPDPSDYEPPSDNESENGGSQENSGSGGAAGGAGIGASTTGTGSASGAGGAKPDQDGGSDVDDDNDLHDEKRTEPGDKVPKGEGRKFSPGVEFADDEDEALKKPEVGRDDNDSGNGNDDNALGDDKVANEMRRDSARGAGSTRGKSDDSSGRAESNDTDDDDDREYPTGTGRRRSKEEDKKTSREDVDDVDYRDELDDEERRKDVDSSRKIEPMINGHKNVTSGHDYKRTDCEDGSYNHHDHHHSHHDSIKWLQDAIPGEPLEDYPILSRANLTTNFNCRDQKYPGYYADVEARCQVFHICQADGRQDSFLCPNGTIFSQISSVCVWWNSFDCEDAPKYYKLNALLYRSAPRNQAKEGREVDGDGSFAGKNEARPIDGARMASRGSAGAADGEDDDDGASIDSLIRAMRRKEAMGKVDSAPDVSGSKTANGNGPTAWRGFQDANAGTISTNKVDKAGADDEATIQRKSTNIEDDADDVGIDDDKESKQTGRLVKSSSSRHTRANAEPRRKRRASVRQAPPKLKSRRMARPSRRWKLRHNPKPKRRA